MESSFNAELRKTESDLNAAVEGAPASEAQAAAPASAPAPAPAPANAQGTTAASAPAALEGQPKT